MAQREYISPNLAADIGIFVKGRDKHRADVVYMVTGVRRNPPQQGTLALIGGFRECMPSRLDSGIYTALKEGSEEAKLGIDISTIEYLREDYDAQQAAVTVTQGNGRNEIKKECVIYYVKTIPTGECEFNEQMGRKRVHATSGYVLPIELGDRVISADGMANWFKAEDDIKELRFPDVTAAVLGNNYSGLPRFGMSHHNTMARLMAEKAGRVYRVELQ